MTYRTRRTHTRSILTFGLGATLAITQLGAGCVPASQYERCGGDAATDDAGRCITGQAPDAGGVRDAGTNGPDAK